MTLSNVEKALYLANLQIRVFPCDPKTRAPLTKRGFYDGSLDPDEIAGWFTIDYLDAVVGVWAGGSGLIALDLDRKNGKDGFATVAARGLTITETEHYTTATGKGEHHIWATDDESLTLVGGVFDKDSGIDIRAGGSYFVWWGDTVPKSRAAFSTDVPTWVVEAATPDVEEFSGTGFSGSVEEWLKTIPDDVMPSSAVVSFLNRIPTGDFGHPEMVDLAWAIARMGAERETGVRGALEELRAAWLRPPYDTPANRRDFEIALRGGINKGGRVQNPVPTMPGFTPARMIAEEHGVFAELKKLYGKVSETSTEIEMSRNRKEMFQVCAEGGVGPGAALQLVASSRALGLSKVSLDSAWFGDGESFYAELAEGETEDPEGGELDTAEAEERDVQETLLRLAEDSNSFTLLTEAEKALRRSPAFRWWGDEYQEWVQGRIKHYNPGYHVAAMWMALSTIVASWGRIPKRGAKTVGCNLYITANGPSSTGKTESLDFGIMLTDAVYGDTDGVVIGDISKLSSVALHRALVLRDQQPSLVYGDEIQSFFQGVEATKWQTGVLGDISGYYGGSVPAKNMVNDKEISGKRARTTFTTYLTGIDTQLLEAINMGHWENGFFLRFLWGFGNPRDEDDYSLDMDSAATLAAAEIQVRVWADEFIRAKAYQEMKWEPARVVEWSDDAKERLVGMKEQIAKLTRKEVHADLFESANGRFADSIMKVATLVALVESSEKVELRHVIIAIDYAGPWHRAMVLAVKETSLDAHHRDTRKLLRWAKANAISQIGKKSYIQSSAIMRAFSSTRSRDVQEWINQLTAEARFIKSGDNYELSED